MTLPKTLSARLKKTFGQFKRGWASLPVRATLGKTSWATSIFFDSKRSAYLLPIKAAVRKSERALLGQSKNFNCLLDLDRAPN